MIKSLDENAFVIVCDANEVYGKGFKHIHEDSTNLMATEQCFYALVALKRASEGKNTLYNMNNAKEFNVRSDAVGLAGKNADVQKMNITNPGKTFADIVGHKDKTLNNIKEYQDFIELIDSKYIEKIGDNIYE